MTTRKSKTLGCSIVLAAALAGCSGPARTGSPVLVDPEKTSRESGSTDDIYDATEKAISSLTQSPRVQAQQGRRIVLNGIVNKTGIPGYDENVIYNRFLSSLVNRAGEQYTFLNRESVRKEREAQISGAVKTSGIDGAPAGADMVLDIELRQLPGARTQTIQYTFTLTNLAGEILWTDSVEIKKVA